MLLIPCPHCGKRDESEFDYGGRALALPRLDAGLQEWHRALHLGNDGSGVADEYWYHFAGCQCWIRTRRNLADHEFIAANIDAGQND